MANASLTARVVGVGDAFTSRYHHACLLLESAGTRLLVDAPPALARALADLSQKDQAAPPVSLDDIDRVLVTHLHGDHVGGLEQLLFYRLFVTRKKTEIIAIPEVLGALWDTRLKGGMDRLLSSPGGPTRVMKLEDYADLCPLGPGETMVGDLAVSWRPTIHHIPTSAIRVASAGGAGATVGYSADTSFDPELIAWLAEADLFFHETNLGIHTPLSDLVALPEATRARMRLIHYPDFHDVSGSPIPCAREGERLVVA